MADEFAQLQNVSLISESDLRDDVAANIQAKSSKESIADQTLVKKTWRAFQQAQQLVNNLHGQLRAAQLNEANKAIWVAGSTGNTQQDNDKKPPSQPLLAAAALRFKHNAALRELDKKGEKLRQVQREAEERQRKRLEEIRNRQRIEASHEHNMHENNNNNNDNKNSMQQSSDVNAEQSSSTIVTAVNNTYNSNKSNMKQVIPHHKQMQLHEHTARPQRVLGITLTSYSGGAVLPSLNRVLVSRADIQAKHLRYEDDADIALYAARLRKRNKLQKANALLRAQRRQEKNDNDELQSSQTSSEFTDFTDTQSIVTSASTATTTTTTANVDASNNNYNNNNNNQNSVQYDKQMHNERKTSDDNYKNEDKVVKEQKTIAVKRENEAHGQCDNDSAATTAAAQRMPDKSSLGKVKMQDQEQHQKQQQQQQQQQEAKDNNSITAIDVDALMQEEEDVGDDLVQKLLAEQQRKSSSSSLSTSTNDKRGDIATIKQKSNKQQQQQQQQQQKQLIRFNAVNTHNSSSSSNTHPIDYSGITLKPQRQVEIIPGIKISARIYRRLFPYQQDGLRWLLHLHSHRTGGILGDEMGLGKTVQVAVLLNALCTSHQLRGPVLIICPMTVLRQWVAQIHRWAPYVRVCVMHMSSTSSAHISREALLQSVQGTPAVVLTTYVALRQHVPLLHSAGFQYIILDEGHKIANPQASITLAAKSFATPHRIILSGSPIQNSLKQLWCLFDFVKPGLLGTLSKFIEEFEHPIGQSKNPRASLLALATAVQCARALQMSIAPYLLRRLKQIVNASLPRRYERIVRVCLTEEQLQSYVDTLASPSVQRLFSQALFYPKLSGALNKDGRDASGSLHVAGRRYYLSSASAGLPSSSSSPSYSSQLYPSGTNAPHGSGHGFSTRGRQTGLHLQSFRVMNQLRQICNHADLNKVLRGLEQEERLLSAPGLGVSVLHRHQMNTERRQNPFNTNTNSSRSNSGSSGISIGYRSFRSNNPVNVMGSGKLQALQQMLREWYKFHHRVLVFSQTRMMLDIIENLCEQENYKYIRMDGTTGHRHRQELIDRFNEDERIFVALLTTRVGGIGVNLTGADRVVIYDPDWNPITDIQARQRAWRIGQTREVCVYRLITRGTVEEAILRRQLAKTYVTDKVLKDPTLQRFFHVQESFVENFFLGPQYEDRVPAGKKHVLAAKQILTDTTHLYGDDPYSAHDHSLFADEVHDKQTQSSTANVHAGNVHTSSANILNNASSAASSQFSTNRTNNIIHHDNNDKDDQVEQTTQKQFGSIAEIITDEDALSSTNGEVHQATPPTSIVTTNNNNNNSNTISNTGNDETSLLKQLINGQQVSISGADSIAQQLAHASAQRALFRATHDTASGKPLRTAQDQRRQFSLSKAAQDFKAKENADRAQQRRYYDEEMRRVRARQDKLR